MLLGELDDLVRPGHRVLGAGDQGRVGGERDVPGLDLVSELVDGVRARSDPDQPCVDDLLRELGVLGEEAITGVQGIRAGLLGDLDQLSPGVDPPRAYASSATFTCKASRSGSA